MKTLLASGAALGLLGISALGIPQTFSGNQFLNTAGVSFEQFVAEPVAWGDVSALKGHWQAHGDTLTFTDSAAVFGVAADEVTAKQQDGQVQSFKIVFRAKGKSVDLGAQLRANVQAFTGEKGIDHYGGFTTFKFKTMTITLRYPSHREVVAEFTRA